MDNEEWRPMKENPDYYEISSMGNIRSVGFSNQWGYHRRRSPRLIHQHPNAKGYMLVNIATNGKYWQMLVHRLVASNFIGDIDGMEINHINGNKRDNRVSNLEICTHSENMRHAYNVLGIEGTSQRPYSTRKRPVECFDLSSKFVAEYPSTREAAEAIGHTHGRISIAARNGSTAFGFKWRYKQQ